MKYKPTIAEIHGPEFRGSLTAKKLLSEPMQGSTGVFAGTHERYFDMSLGESSYVVGNLRKMGGKQIVSIDHLYVARMLRGKGLGERLLKNFIAEAKTYGAQELWSDSVSNMALGLRAKVLGETAMTFYDSESPELGFLPITFDQARATNDRTYDAWLRSGKSKEELPSNLGVYVNLNNIDTTGWERPGVADEAEEVMFLR